MGLVVVDVISDQCHPKPDDNDDDDDYDDDDDSDDDHDDDDDDDDDDEGMRTSVYSWWLMLSVTGVVAPNATLADKHPQPAESPNRIFPIQL